MTSVTEISGSVASLATDIKKLEVLRAKSNEVPREEAIAIRKEIKTIEANVEAIAIDLAVGILSDLSSIADSLRAIAANTAPRP